MSEPPPPISTDRYYRHDDEYLSDVASMEAAGWRLVAVRRAPDSTIVATYAYGAITPPAPEQSFSPADPISKRLKRIAYGIFLVFFVIFDLGVMVYIGQVAPDSSLGSPPSCADTSSCASYYPTYDATQLTVCVTPLPTATPHATGLTGLTLGGPIDAFRTRFGCESVVGAIWYDVNFDGQILYIEVGENQSAYLANVESSDGLDRVSSIAVYWFHSLPSLATMRATMTLFFPPHSVALGANTKVSPTEYLYRSAPLAAMFGSDAFVNNAGLPVTPGTFSEVCDGASCTLQIGDWNEG